MEVCVKNSKKKTSYFEQSKQKFLPLYMNHAQKTKKSDYRDYKWIVKQYYFEVFQTEFGMIRGPKIELYPIKHVDKILDERLDFS